MQEQKQICRHRVVFSSRLNRLGSNEQPKSNRTAMLGIGARPVLYSTFRLRARHDKPRRVICTQASSFDAAHGRRELVKKSSPGVVFLQTMKYFKYPNADRLIAVSTGFVVTEDGYIMTCFHNLYPKIYVPNPEGISPEFYVPNPEGISSAELSQYSVYVSFFDRTLPSMKAEIITLVPDLDIAILKVSLPETLKSSVISLSKIPAETGDFCLIIGHQKVEYASRFGFVSSPMMYPHQFEDNIFEIFFKKAPAGFYVIEVGILADKGCSGSPLLNVKAEAMGMLNGALGGSGGSVICTPANICAKVLSHAMKKRENDDTTVEGSMFVEGGQFTRQMKCSGDEEEEEMLVRAVEIRRGVTVEIFKEAMRKGKFGITYYTNLVSRLGEFIDYVIIRAAEMKQLPEFLDSTFNFRAMTFIDDSNVVHLSAIRHVAEWVKSINVKGRFIGVALTKSGEKMLGHSPEELDEIVGYVESQGVRRDWMGYVMNQCPQLLSYSMEELKSRMQFFLDMGMNDKDFGTMVFDYPQVLGYFSMEEMKQKVKITGSYIISYEDVGRLLAFRPELLRCSIEERWKPLVKYLYYLGVLKDADNDLTGVVPASLGQLSRLLVLDLSRNSLTGSIPPSCASLGNLTLLDMSSSFLSGIVPADFGALFKLQFSNLSNNSLSSSIPTRLGDVSSLVDLDLRLNAFSGSVPPDLGGLRNLQKMVFGYNLLACSLPGNLFPNLTQLQFIVLHNNNFTGDLPDVLWSIPALLYLDASNNNFSGTLPNTSGGSSVNAAVLNLSHNMFYGDLAPVLSRFSFIDITSNYFKGRVPNYIGSNASLDGNGLTNLSSDSSQRSGTECASFYSERGLVFDNFGLPNATQPPPSVSAKKSHRYWIIFAGVLGGVLFMALLVGLVVLLIVCCRNRGARNQRGTTGVVAVPAGGSPQPPGLALNFSSLGDGFTYQQLLLATDIFNDVNLIKHGHSGDLFRGILEGGVPVVIKKVDLQAVKKETYMSELDFFSKVSQARLVPLLGHCLEKENENEKFLFYKYMPNGDLSSSLYRKTSSED
ncbi:hypothetical protein RHGRI_032714 [Rhododendron griersonianum]|uniref:Protein kinase domain-containing protein n=1 Tax=Rhododendron griersonianum TaxID=479676 RepID=A0AAV6ICU0_9ERIC|nr:hypothetical protein RHGRI_032714 [Rhododendron griersonianum]